MSVAEHTGPASLQLPAGRLRLLPSAPLIAPAKHLVFPMHVPGEEEALSRGSIFVEICPARGAMFLAQCAFGFQGNGVATGLWPGTDDETALVAAGGYAYLLNLSLPERTVLLPLRPVVSIATPADSRRIVLVGFHYILVLGPDGERWQSERISWEGITVTSVQDDVVHGTGWDMIADEDVPFSLDLNTRLLSGGGFRQSGS